MKITRQQIDDWLENPITIAFKAVVVEQKEDAEKTIGVDCYHPFDPQKTQEILAGLNGSIDAFELVIDTLDGEGLLDE